MRARKSWGLVALGIATAIVPTGILFAGVNLLFPIPFLLGIVVIGAGLAGRAGKNAKISALVLAAVAWIGPFALTAYLNRSGPPIEFVIPVGFQGPIEVVRDRSHGDELTYEHGRYVITVPASGVVRLRVEPPVYRWHQEFCRDANGQIRRLEGKGSIAGDSHRDQSDDGVVNLWEVH